VRSAQDGQAGVQCGDLGGVERVLGERDQPSQRRVKVGHRPLVRRPEHAHKLGLAVASQQPHDLQPGVSAAADQDDANLFFGRNHVFKLLV
jgi:hypothetical protein